ncbi:hypothetical protein L198_03958 [Cryptococcus wingfieldii CBS 7118]|uniref:Vacuolar import and degradation protein 21 n=1 Tax=Cryptococcus wingfieldii CBS 7118 TaxID=1295528 RepID=A0A1E3J957_9TREE|nr:hypothetical protein L198_03958 [Cryptococcus wingfieldii CBS 7118]ODN97394.1 hypothetical protein L198_03958 [Cryptococcus wingfieldii CBS 7118]
MFQPRNNLIDPEHRRLQTTAPETDKTLSGFNEWKRKFELGHGSINSLKIPDLPPPSPPPTTKVFPDETVEKDPTPAGSTSSAPAAKPAASKPAPILPPPPSSTTIESPLTAAPLESSLDDVEEEPTVALSEVQPRPYFTREYSPPADLEVPPWVPVDNYRPAQTPVSPPPSLMPLTSAYPSELPPLPPLPLASKRRRLANSDPQPDMFQLSSSLAINPVSKDLSHSTKCVLTCDWKIAMEELRHIRAMDKIKAKKAEGRWSLRQPKKARAPPIAKAHWDYLLEEMEWMRTDFSEERRWKVVQAREFAYEVVEWHLASSDERKALMVGGRGWGESNKVPIPGHSGKRRLQEVATQEAEDDDVEMLVGQEGDLPGEGEASRVLESMDEMKEQEQARLAKKDEDAKIAKASETEGEADADGEDDADGEEETIEASGSAQVGLSEIDAVKTESDASVKPPRRLSNPLVINGITIDKRFSSRDDLVATRKPVLDAPLAAATINLETLPKPAPVSDVDSKALPASPDSPPSFTDLFPELASYDGPSPPEEQEQARRPEGGSSRIAHTSRLMDIRPTFVSTLQPAKNLRNGHWDVHDGPYYEPLQNPTIPNIPVITASSTLFHGVHKRSLNSLQPHDMTKPSAHHLRHQHPWSTEEDQCLVRLVEMYPFNWELIAESYNLEMVMVPVEKRGAYECWERWYYAYGEGKNKPRPDALPPPGSAALNAGNNTPVPQSAVSTPGIPSAIPSPARPPQSATAIGGISVPSLPTPLGEGLPDGAPPPPGMSKREKQQAKPKYEGTKRSIRHQAIYDAVKRLNRRREAAKVKSYKDNAQRKIINVHESHVAFTSDTSSTPWELVEAKYQRDMQMAQQRQQRAIQEQQRALAMRQQQAMLLAQQQQQQGQMRPPMQQQGQQMPPNMPNMTPRVGPNGQPLPKLTPNQQQLLNGAVGPNGQALPPMPPTPQQQQQILNAVAQMNNGNGSPRMGPNGQPIQGLAPSQQQLLNAVALASAARHQQKQRQQNGAVSGQGTPQMGMHPPPRPPQQG